MNRRESILRYLGGAAVLIGVALMLWGWRTQSTSAPTTAPPSATRSFSPTKTAKFTPTPPPTQTPIPAPIVPTARPSTTSTALSTAATDPGPSPTATHVPASVGSEQWRVGISIPLRTPLDYDPDALGVGWVTNWRAYVDRSVPTGVEFAQMVRMKGCQLSLDLESLTSLADAKIPSATPTPVSTESLTQFVIDLQQDTTLNITYQIP